MRTRVERPLIVHMPMSLQPVGAQCAFFDRHLKTHDQHLPRNIWVWNLFFEQCSKIRKVCQVPFFELC